MPLFIARLDESFDVFLQGSDSQSVGNSNEMTFQNRPFFSLKPCFWQVESAYFEMPNDASCALDKMKGKCQAMRLRCSSCVNPKARKMLRLVL